MQLFKSSYIKMVLPLLAGLVLGYIFFGGSSSPEPEGEHHHAHQQQEYTCSMHPQIRQAEPGDCPICGMALIPVASGGQHEDPQLLQMSPVAMELAKVATMKVGQESGEGQLELNGKLTLDETRTSSQVTHIGGRVEALAVNFTGDYVQKGAVLATLYSPELVTAQEELLQAVALKSVQPSLYQAARRKLANWKLSETEIDQIEKSGQVKTAFPIRADVSGVVMEKMVNVGDHLKMGQPLFRISDLKHLWVQFEIYESQLARVKAGDEVQYRIAGESRSRKGKVDFVDRVVDPKTRVAYARFGLENPEMALKPETFVSGALQMTAVEQSSDIVVPASAVLWTGKRSLVYVMQETEAGVGFKARAVTLGEQRGTDYQILEGLKVGEEIAVKGAFSIDAAAQLEGKSSMMTLATSTPEDQVSIPDWPERQLPVTDQVQLKFQSLLKAYLKMKKTLAADDWAGAHESAGTFQKELKTFRMKDFKGESHQQWMAIKPYLDFATGSIYKAKSMQKGRQAFESVAQGMTWLVQGFEGFPTLYINHCPMVNNDQGADWLDDQTEILNPYFGSQMLKCGYNKATLNDKP
ncbi:efflux RND transporter periplasmic adaptor subunit [Persicobacter diffluens]|uniref:Efflux RND transporter periplasmic adaptor subunit n=1 Tax=Persicobacter diffluens TaxID=981 RepID=A0AAN4VZT1_9BACT|nr:hypothetical protein PEDI_33200 [Persicobacter diffluens]